MGWSVGGGGGGGDTRVTEGAESGVGVGITEGAKKWGGRGGGGGGGEILELQKGRKLVKGGRGAERWGEGYRRWLVPFAEGKRGNSCRLERGTRVTEEAERLTGERGHLRTAY